MIENMYFSRLYLFLLPILCIFAQTPPSPAPPPKPAESKPGVVVNGPGAPPPSVKMEVVKPPEGKLPDVPADKVIVSIGDEKITAGEFSQFIDSLPEQMRSQARGPARRQLAENLVKIKLLAQQARRDKADQEPMFKVQQAYQMDNLLAVYYLNNYLKNAKISDDELRKYYEDHKADYSSVRARHILIRFKGSRVPLKPNQKDLTEEEALAQAQDIKKRLAAGADFAQVAQQESDDTGSAAKGGDLGEFHRGQMVAPFDEAAATLPIGIVSEPVKTPYGYHIIQVQSRDAKTFDEVKEDIEKKIKPTLTDKLIGELRTKSNVLLDDSYFGPPPPATPPVITPQTVK